MSLNLIEQAQITRVLSRLRSQVRQLQSFFKGTGNSTARFDSLSITNAKILGMIADKILAGNFIVQIGVGDSVDGSIIFDAANIRKTMSDSDDVRLVIGKVAGVFTVRISLETIDALTSTDPREYSLFADDDNVLIKEHSRGVLESGGTVEHNLGYLPHYYAYAQITSGRMQIANSYDPNQATRSIVSETELTINGAAEFDGNAKYFIFYDDIPV